MSHFYTGKWTVVLVINLEACNYPKSDPETIMWFVFDISLIAINFGQLYYVLCQLPTW